MKEEDFSTTYIPEQEIRLTIDGRPVVIGQERGTTTTIFENIICPMLQIAFMTLRACCG